MRKLTKEEKKTIAKVIIAERLICLGVYAVKFGPEIAEQVKNKIAHIKEERRRTNRYSILREWYEEEGNDIEPMIDYIKDHKYSFAVSSEFRKSMQ